VITAGIDAGSRALKIVLFDADANTILAEGAADQSIDQQALAERLLESLLENAGIAREALGGIVATGYGRNLIQCAGTTVTEITCHARGVRFIAPDAMTIIEIGGQDSKLIRLDAKGNVRDFSMNDRCAAGTGRFFEVVASRLGADWATLDQWAGQSAAPASISSTCVVFAETEIIGLLASGTPPADIVAGVQLSIAKRVVAMAGRHVEAPILFTGGVALVPGMAKAIETALDRPVRMAEKPQFTGALGAAIMAATRT